jgi:hypothetical protein
MGFSPNFNFVNGAKAQKLEVAAYPPAKAGGNSCAPSLRIENGYFKKLHHRVPTAHFHCEDKAEKGKINDFCKMVLLSYQSLVIFVLPCSTLPHV